MRHWIIVALVAVIAAAVGAGIAFVVANKTRVEVAVGEMRGELLSLNPPPGTLTREQNTAYKATAAAAPAAATAPGAAAGDWPSYNKTLTSERFSARSIPRTSASSRCCAPTTPDNSRASRPA
jgi:alcohol dehydrogenase (cytochrome c)